MANPAREEPIVGHFKKGPEEKRVQRILDRALEKRVREAARTRTPKVRMPTDEAPKGGSDGLGALLAKAVGLKKGGRNKPSIRMSAPDGGGRSFHFEHYTINKDAGGLGGRGASFADGSKRTTPAKSGKAERKVGSAAAHLRYIEREDADQWCAIPLCRPAERRLLFPTVRAAFSPSRVIL